MREFLIKTSHKPRPLPSGRWVMTQRWNDLLFAHWPVAPAILADFVPQGLQIDTFQGSAWLGVVPFWMDRVKFRGIPPIPGARRFPELNLRTYVRDPRTGTPGVFFLSLDAGNPLAVAFARTVYRLPYYWAEMHIEEHPEREFTFYSRRKLSKAPVMFVARYRGLGPSKKLADIGPGTLEYFLTERYCLFTSGRDGEPLRANIHHVPWPLEHAAADIERNDLASVLGITLPNQPPVLHYSRRLAVYVWQLERMRPAHGAQRVPAATVPST